jgi:hypothetical protein
MVPGARTAEARVVTDSLEGLFRRSRRIAPRELEREEHLDLPG